MRAWWSLCVLASLASATPAFAQSSSEAGAQTLFDEGRALVSSHHYAEACEKFEASEKLSPAGGTLFNLADCYEKAGKPASAWARYNEAADRAAALHRDDAEKFARDRARALSGALAFLKVDVDPANKSTAGLSITIDGAALTEAGWDTPIPADPGPHEIEASAPGKKSWSTHAAVAGQGSTTEVRVDALEDAPAPVLGPRQEPVHANVDTSRGSTQRLVGLGVGALGILGIGVGSFFGLTAMSKHNSIQCPNDLCSDPGDKAKNDDARSDATISTVAFIAGGALLAGGVILYLTAPKSESGMALRIAPTFAGNGARVGLEGRF